MRQRPMARRRSRAAAALTAALAVTALTSACDVSRLDHLEFAQDSRLTFTSPAARSLVTSVPIRVAWTMKDFTPTQAPSTGTTSGAYGVFVDLPPIAVGQGLKSVAGSDETCKQDPKCPDAIYLQQKGVYVTVAPDLVLTQLPMAESTAGDKEHHEITVVLLNNRGVRTSESAWYVDFKYPKRSSQ